MNKKILILLVSVLAVAMLAAPVMAKPTKGNKVAVTLMLVGTGVEIIPPIVETGNVAHLDLLNSYDATITFDDHPEIDPLVGTVEVNRKLVVVPQPNKGYDAPAGDTKWILTDYYVFNFDTEEEDRGFEGNGLVIIDGATIGSAAPWEKSRSNYLFHGTGEFEGQTLNFRHAWNPFIGGVPGTPGYWLKYEPPTP